jgi:hypothetical protein
MHHPAEVALGQITASDIEIADAAVRPTRGVLIRHQAVEAEEEKPFFAGAIQAWITLGARDQPCWSGGVTIG